MEGERLFFCPVFQTVDWYFGLRINGTKNLTERIEQDAFICGEFYEMPNFIRENRNFTHILNG